MCTVSSKLLKCRISMHSICEKFTSPLLHLPSWLEFWGKYLTTLKSQDIATSICETPSYIGSKLYNNLTENIHDEKKTLKSTHLY